METVGMPPVLADPDDAPPLERRIAERMGGLGSWPDPLSSKASPEGEEESGEVEEVVLLVPVAMVTSGEALPGGVLYVESNSVLGFRKRCKREYLEPRRRD
jgi:hypothetical protein